MANQILIKKLETNLLHSIFNVIRWSALGMFHCMQTTLSPVGVAQFKIY